VGGWPWCNLGVIGGYSYLSVDFGDSFCNVIACFYGIGNNHKLVFSSSLRGEVSYSSSS